LRQLANHPDALATAAYRDIAVNGTPAFGRGQILPTNDREPSLLNRDRHRGIDGEPGLFQPGSFQEKEWRDGVAAARLAFQRVVPMAFADFESAIFYGVAPIDDTSKCAL